MSINEKHSILAPHRLVYDRDWFFWPLLWGNHAPCGEDPCDDLHPKTAAYVMRVCRHERARR